MAETIRVAFMEAGIHILAWEHAPSEPTSTSTPEAKPLIERLAQLYPQLPKETDSSQAADAVPR